MLDVLRRAVAYTQGDLRKVILYINSSIANGFCGLEYFHGNFSLDGGSLFTDNAGNITIEVNIHTMWIRMDGVKLSIHDDEFEVLDLYNEIRYGLDFNGEFRLNNISQ